MLVQIPGSAPLKLSLPFGVDANLGSAALIDGGKRLLLQLPFKAYTSFLDEVRFL